MSSKKPAEAKVSNVPPFGLRMLPDLKDRIAAAAAESGRSMNAEIVQRLELALTEDLWEREKFVNLLNFKQLTIDKVMHMLSASIAKQRSLEAQVKYERALRIAMQQTVMAVCQAVVNDPKSSLELIELVANLAHADIDPGVIDTEDADDQALREAIGDRDDVTPNWENELSDADKKILEDSRDYVKPFE